MNGVQRVPFRPMLARLAHELPAGDWLYEPKWDGFRCVALAEGGAVDLRSRHGRPLTRYFPEVAEPIGALASRSDGLVLDGELVIRVGGEFDFQSLLARTHPAASRVARLARETPATYVAFDLLALAGRDLASAPFATRRALLEQVMERAPAGLALTPATRDVGVARRWLARYEGGGVDGVVAKALDGPYVAGKRGWVKVKPQRTADCVVAGLRLLAGGRAVGSLLLGLWDGPTLRHVGVAAAFTDAQRVALLEDLRPDVTTLGGHPWERGFGLERSPLGRLGGSAGRWDPASMTLDWTPLRPERVVEVEYDRVDEGRFRHPARFLRWRPDREARSCGFDQLGAGCATADGAGASY